MCLSSIGQTPSLTECNVSRFILAKRFVPTRALSFFGIKETSIRAALVT